MILLPCLPVLQLADASLVFPVAADPGEAPLIVNVPAVVETVDADRVGRRVKDLPELLLVFPQDAVREDPAVTSAMNPSRARSSPESAWTPRPRSATHFTSPAAVTIR